MPLQLGNQAFSVATTHSGNDLPQRIILESTLPTYNSGELCTVPVH